MVQPARGDAGLVHAIQCVSLSRRRITQSPTDRLLHACGVGMRPPSPRRLMAAVSAAQQAIAAAGDRIDHQLRADTIEGQSDAFELMDRFADLVLADEHLANLARYKAIQLEKRAATH